MKPNNFRIIGETVTIFYKKYKVYLDKSTFLKYYKDYRFIVQKSSTHPYVFLYKYENKKDIRINLLKLVVENSYRVKYKDGNKLNLCSSNLSIDVNTYRLIYNSITNEVYVKIYFDNHNLFGLIDFKTYLKIRHLKWYVTSTSKYSITGYVRTSIGKTKKSFLLHKLVFGKPTRGKEIDHINRNALDNRSSNLREVFHQENCMNCGPRRDSFSKYKGVTYNKRFSKKWEARLILNKWVIRKRFHSEINAAKEYDKYVKEYCSGVGYLNFP